MAALKIDLPTMTISDDKRSLFAGLGEHRPAPGVQWQLERISHLPKPKQRVDTQAIARRNTSTQGA